MGSVARARSTRSRSDSVSRSRALTKIRRELNKARPHRDGVSERLRRDRYLPASRWSLRRTASRAWLARRTAWNLSTTSVAFTRFFQTEDPDDGPAESPGDYYAKVKIGDFPYESTFEQHVDQAGDISPNWSFNRTVDSSAINVPVVIEIWDHDDTSPDDEMDISPSGRALDLSVELNTSVFRGDIEGIAKGESEGTEEDRGKVFFTISTSLSGDTDGDGIPDGAELDGFRDASGTVFTDMAAMGADPCRKTIAVEIDYMSGAADGHTHQPQAPARTSFRDQGTVALPASRCRRTASTVSAVRPFAEIPTATVPRPPGCAASAPAYSATASRPSARKLAAATPAA